MIQDDHMQEEPSRRSIMGVVYHSRCLTHMYIYLMRKHQKGDASTTDDVVHHLSRWDKIEDEALNEQYIVITKLHLQRWVSKTRYQKEGGWFGKCCLELGIKTRGGVDLYHSRT